MLNCSNAREFKSLGGCEMDCPNCGKDNEQASRLCRGCGSKLHREVPEIKPGKVKKLKKKK